MTPESQWPLLTINVLAYNRREEVRQTLTELQSVDYPREQLEILVVDNASSDGTKEMVEAEFPEVKLVVLSPNRGIAGWNAGFEEGKGDFFLVLDDDSSPESGLKEAVAFLKDNPQIGILALKITGGWATHEALEDNSELMGFIGCGALIRRELVEKIGGYAPWLYLYAHEWEYGVRCLEAGFDIRYFKNCIIHHRGSLAMRSFKKVSIYSTRNNLLIIHKYFARQRPLLMFRLMFHMLNWARMEFGPEKWRMPFYVLRGFGLYLREAPKLKQTFVKPEVQRRYVNQYHWTLAITKLASNYVMRRFERDGQTAAPGK